MKMDLEMTIYVDIEVNTEILTKVVMDNYEKYFYDVSKDADYNEFETQLEKHTAYIAKTIANNEHIKDIEGYGDLKYLVKSVDVSSDSIRIS